MKQKAYKARVLKEQTYELLVSYYTANGVEWATLSAHKRRESGDTVEIGHFKIPVVLLRQLVSEV